MAAEGGTAENHSEVIFRSKSIWGPYEVFSGNPILTQRDLPADRANPITCSGHADLLQTAGGEWMAVCLACQPYSGNFYNTGRQTFILPVDWSGEWPVILEQGKAIPSEVKSPIKTSGKDKIFSEKSANWRDDFDKPELAFEWNFIRTPVEKWYEIKNGNLIMNARSVGIADKANPSFIGRRQQFANTEMGTSVRLEKDKDLEAGLVAFQNEKNYYKMVIQQTNGTGYLQLSSASGEILRTKLENFKPGECIFLKMKVMGKDFSCEYSLDNKTWRQFGHALDAAYLSTTEAGGFTGTYFGLYAYATSPAKALFDMASCKLLNLPK